MEDGVRPGTRCFSYSPLQMNTSSFESSRPSGCDELSASHPRAARGSHDPAATQERRHHFSRAEVTQGEANGRRAGRAPSRGLSTGSLRFSPRCSGFLTEGTDLIVQGFRKETRTKPEPRWQACAPFLQKRRLSAFLHV